MIHPIHHDQGEMEKVEVMCLQALQEYGNAVGADRSKNADDRSQFKRIINR